MSLRLRLFLLLGTLMAVLAGAQWWLIRSLTQEVTAEVREVAFLVGESMIMQFVTTRPPDDPHAQRQVVVERKVSQDVQFWYGKDEAAPAGDPTHFERLVLRLEDDGPHEGALLLEGPHLQRRIPIPHHSTAAVVERFANRLLLGTLGLLALGLVIAGAVAHRVTAPLSALAAAARQVGGGTLGAQVPVTAGGEVGTAIQAFNRMSGHLQELAADARRLRARQHLGELGEVARGLAHSLRNPLNALGLSVDELGQEPADEALRLQLAETARRQIRRMDGAIRSFLALASAGVGTAEPVAVAPLLQDVALEVLQDAGGRVRVEVEVADDLPALPAVLPELRAVLQALVVNAAEASPEGGRVLVRASAAGPERLRVEVCDQGPGVPPAVRQRLFTPHVSTKPHGSGMGLYLAHRIATTRYGGSLELCDLPDAGTRAVLELSPRASGGEGDAAA